MAGMLQRITPGEKLALSAGTWNRFISTTELSDEERLARVIDQAFLRMPRTLLRVKNNSGATRSRGHVLGVGIVNPIVTPATDVDLFWSEACFVGGTPTLTQNRRKFVILPKELMDGEVGPGIIAGWAFVKVDILSALHTFATIKNNDCTQLESNFWGRAFIHWQESGTGLKWCLVELGNFTYPRVIGKFATSVPKGQTGTLRVHVGTGNASAESNPLTTITGVYSRYGETGTGYCRVSFDNDGPEVDATECGV